MALQLAKDRPPYSPPGHLLPCYTHHSPTQLYPRCHKSTRLLTDNWHMSLNHSAVTETRQVLVSETSGFGGFSFFRRLKAQVVALPLAACLWHSLPIHTSIRAWARAVSEVRIGICPFCCSLHTTW